MIKDLSERWLFNRIILFEFCLLVLLLLNIATMRGVEAFSVWFEVYVLLSSLFGLVVVFVFLWHTHFFNVVPYRGEVVGDVVKGKFE